MKTVLRHRALHIVRPTSQVLFQLRSNKFTSHVMEISLMWRLHSARTRQADCYISCGNSLPTNHFNIHTSSDRPQEREFAPEHELSSRSLLTKSPCMPECTSIAEADFWHLIVMLTH